MSVEQFNVGDRVVVVDERSDYFSCHGQVADFIELITPNYPVRLEEYGHDMMFHASQLAHAR